MKLNAMNPIPVLGPSGQGLCGWVPCSCASPRPTVCSQVAQNLLRFGGSVVVTLQTWERERGGRWEGKVSKHLSGASLLPQTLKPPPKLQSQPGPQASQSLFWGLWCCLAQHPKDKLGIPQT